MWNFVTPELQVPDLAAAERFYRDVLGFEVTRLRKDFSTAQLGRAELFLREGETPLAGSVCCVRVDDADALWALYTERGARVLSSPENKSWGMREFTLEDPHGHRFRIGHPTR